jgi:hypothetical protein
MNAAAHLSPHLRFMGNPMEIGRFLIVAGLVILAAGALWPVIARVGFGRLPGDLVIERQNMTLYFPLATAIIVSIAFSLLLWLLAR